MNLGLSRRSTGHDFRSWPVLLLLMVGVLVPTLAILWFMSRAMDNERLAVRQRLDDVYRAKLTGWQQDLQLYWQDRIHALEVDPSIDDGSTLFAERIRGGLADSVLVYDAEGTAVYPSTPPLSGLAPERPSSAWRRAESLERSGQHGEAAARYGAIAETTTDPHLAARALQAKARCLLRGDQTPSALSLLADELSQPRYEAAVDPQGRWIAPSAQLRVLQLLADPTDPMFRRVVDSLTEQLLDYDAPSIPSSQRVFLMKQLSRRLEDLGVTAPTFDTLASEDLARRYLESSPPAPSSSSLGFSGIPGVWHLATPSGKVVALFEEERLLQDLEALRLRQPLPQNTTVELLAPGEEPQAQFLVSLPAGRFLPDWQLVLHPEDQDLFTTAANQQRTAYLLIAVLVVATLVVLTLLVARVIQRQLRLTRLKNDLLATVSHELKTPLASMRLLVDTLLETGIEDSRRVREYLQLIATENARLSRLVESFLTFSRMEQNRQSFEKVEVSPSDIIEETIAALGERFQAEDCHFEVEISSELPNLVADPDALVMVLLNLLDNAYKYSEGNRHIHLDTYLENGHVCFAVHDQGIGMSQRTAGKIFDRFYQVDQSLSRSENGCGLGLSIVQFIVNAHDGQVDVTSRLGEGSTFTVRLPATSTAHGNPQEVL